ncbi:UDP-N-acetylmuramoyl-L-alanine--D-glutamate ligase [Bermanella marisrubri]|uniref:UDP-N-acetylmuramoylalanine--D-glutamate ligase n=1 Tax=Bermanella marisrubri TaxID=207949 RepID=Q1MYB8_9GAMM|nr:UDP-N-acetylmuramoyl-L-alanine--D-glutamate ligase [Bermanella marisrubri]EAT10949.1 UDP-N-acetylmuramoylalanine--D-glutamate ligase [Oceanobacter sp. RED65] [Bermanella marisrubri]QIZ85097.1 UDP-N-acetylmuramoyl-L-alanine--D-glutamate ligase [Bermanella marisrubri]
MSQVNALTNYHVVIGLGKTGDSAVRHLLAQGENVIAMDTREEAPFASELRATYPDLQLIEGGLDASVLINAARIIASPGIPLATDEIQRAIDAGVPVVSDIQVFAEAANAPIIAITGSNAKSTVTTLVGEMAKQCGLKAAVGGNLGTPALELLNSDIDVYVMELSSFQLEATEHLNAKVATVLNISPDHLDRYDSYEGYYQTKYKIFNGCEKAVINLDDNLAQPKTLNCPEQIGFSIDGKGADFVLDRTAQPWQLIVEGDALLSVDQLKIKGLHNYSNALAALALGHGFGLDMDGMLKALKSFPGLDHRCQWIKQVDEVDFYNDSKGTNVGATEAALKGLGPEYAKRIVLMLGGVGKDADFKVLRPVIDQYVSKVIVYGQDQDIIAKDLSGVDLDRAESFEQAFEMAYRNADHKGAVVFSPACASFDMFSGFEARGEAFKSMVEAL